MAFGKYALFDTSLSLPPRSLADTSALTRPAVHTSPGWDATLRAVPLAILSGCTITEFGGTRPVLAGPPQPAGSCPAPSRKTSPGCSHPAAPGAGLPPVLLSRDQALIEPAGQRRHGHSPRVSVLRLAAIWDVIRLPQARHASGGEGQTCGRLQSSAVQLLGQCRIGMPWRQPEVFDTARH